MPSLSRPAVARDNVAFIRPRTFRPASAPRLTLAGREGANSRVVLFPPRPAMFPFDATRPVSSYTPAELSRLPIHHLRELLEEQGVCTDSNFIQGPRLRHDLIEATMILQNASSPLLPSSAGARRAQTGTGSFRDVDFVSTPPRPAALNVWATSASSPTPSAASSGRSVPSTGGKEWTGGWVGHRHRATFSRRPGSPRSVSRSTHNL